LKHPLLVIFLATMFVSSVFNIGGAWSAKLGHGKYGTFTAEYELRSG